MKDVRVASRYAAALFGIAQRDEVIDAVSRDIALIERFLAEVPNLRVVLLQPLLSQPKKLKVVTDAFDDRITATTLNFLKLLIRKRREGLIDECIREYRARVAEHYNTVDAVAHSAVPLTQAQKELLTQNLQKTLGKTVHLTAEVDSTMLGGLVVRIGDMIIDGGIHGRLRRLQEHLMGAGS